jgi:preprotein translocase subunit Sec63
MVRRQAVTVVAIIALFLLYGSCTAAVGAEEEAVAAAEAELAGKTHYEVLGVAPTATLVELKRAFRSLTLELHPDKLTHASEAKRTASQVRFLRVVEGCTLPLSILVCC